MDGATHIHIQIIIARHVHVYMNHIIAMLQLTTFAIPKLHHPDPDPTPGTDITSYILTRINF